MNPLTYLPTPSELAALWPFWILCGAFFLTWIYSMFRAQREQKEYERQVNREAIQWELDTAKRKGWNEVRKEASGFPDDQLHWRNL